MTRIPLIVRRLPHRGTVPVLGLMGVLWLLSSPAAAGAIRYVALDGAHVPPFATWAMAATNIQAAIDVAMPGDTILVSNGVYQAGGRPAAGASLTNRVVLEKPVSVQSLNGAAVTLIQGAWDPAATNGPGAVRCVWMAGGSSLQGFTLTGGATQTGGAPDTRGGGVWAQSSTAVISQCIITGNRAAESGGGVFQGTLRQCVVDGNAAASGGGANLSELVECTLTGNSATLGGGVFGGVLRHCSLTGNVARIFGGGAYQSDLTNCKLTGNSADLGGGAFGGGFNLCTLSGNTAATSGGGVFGGSLTNCIVYFNAAPDGFNHLGSVFSYSCTSPLPAGPGNRAADPQFVNAAAGNYRLRFASPCVDRGDTSAAGVIAVDLDGNPRVVNGAVDMGAYENQIHYVVPNNPSPSPPYVTWATAATNIQDAIDAVLLDGATVLVSNGVYETGSRPAPGSLLPNRVVIDKAITVRSVHGPAFTSIRGEWDPVSTNGEAAVRCVWMTNGASLVGFSLTRGATRATGGADREGGAVWAASTTAEVADCVIRGNAAYFLGGGAFQGTLNRCVLEENAAVLGGGAYESVLNNCRVLGNTAALGGGAFGGILNHCTLTGNAAPFGGGGVAGAVLRNCIVYFNEVGGNYSDSLLWHSCTTPLPAGSGNFTQAPRFVDGGSGDVRLADDSPCRDTGDNAFAPPGPDLDGNPRIVHHVVDVGAYENQSSPPPDFDGDGLPNWWETRYGLHPFVPNAPEANSDDDLMTDLEEYIAATDPTDASSFFAVGLERGGGSVQVRLDTAAGRIYAVEYNSALVPMPQAWFELTNGIPGSGGPLTIPEPSTATNRHYRGRVRLAP